MTVIAEPPVVQQTTAVDCASHQPRRGGSILVVDFHRDGNSALYRTFGWSGQEASHVWSMQRSCGLTLPPPLEDHPLVLDVDLSICGLQHVVSSAVVRVSVNGNKIAAAAVHGRTLVRCKVPAALLSKGQPIDLRFDHPCCVRLDMLNVGTEDRVLGLCFYAIYLYPSEMSRDMQHFGARPPERLLHEAEPWTEDVSAGHGETAVYRFSPSDAGCAFLEEGWRHDQEGNAWADGRISRVRLPAPSGDMEYYAQITLSPLFVRSRLPSQRITILLNGSVIGQYKTGNDTSLVIALPKEAYQNQGSLQVAFAVPDGLPMHLFDPSHGNYFFSFVLNQIEISPIPPAFAHAVRQRDDDVTIPAPTAVSARFLDEDIEPLQAAIKHELDLDCADLLRQFESLGDNCAFGLAQRKAGAEVLGLLRFANTPLQRLRNALSDEFRAVTDKAEISLARSAGDDSEYNLFVNRYGIRWHTEVFAGQSDKATVLAQQWMRLTYLRRKFYETLKGGRKILTISRAEPRKHQHVFVFADEPTQWEEKPEPLRLAEILPLFLKLNEHGTNTLLFLTRCAHGRRPGTVELLAPGLMRGYVDDFVISDDASRKDHVTWLRVAANALLLDRGPNASFRQKETT